MIMPHPTGHVIARDGCLLRADVPPERSFRAETMGGTPQ
jgi:hypothetical protein